MIREITLPLSFKPFADLGFGDLQRLMANAVPEGARIDYKRDHYAPNEGKEFLKDVSSFANSHGGYIVIGAEEENGLIKALPGIDASKIDQEILRLENWARDGLEPRIVGLQMRRIELEGGVATIVVAIPKSMNPPHRVSSQNSNRFFVRNSNGKHEASVEELRQLFGYSAGLTESIQRFMKNRRQIIMAGEDTVADFDNGRLIVHVANASTFGDNSFVDIKKLYADPYRFAPVSQGGITKRMTLEGVLVGSEMEGKFWDRALIYRDGTIETVFTNFFYQPREVVLVPGLSLVKDILDAIGNSLNGLVGFGGTGPFVIGLALQVSKGMPIAFREAPFRYPKFDRAIVELPLMTLVEYNPSADTPTVIRPLLDNLWNSVGLAECDYFKNNVWQPPR